MDAEVWLVLSGRDGDLEGLEASGLSGQREDGPSVDASWGDVDAGVANFGRGDQFITGP